MIIYSLTTSVVIPGIDYQKVIRELNQAYKLGDIVIIIRAYDTLKSNPIYRIRLLGVVWSSNEAHMVDALAVRGDERRDSLR